MSRRPLAELTVTRGTAASCGEPGIRGMVRAGAAGGGSRPDPRSRPRRSCHRSRSYPEPASRPWPAACGHTEAGQGLTDNPERLPGQPADRVTQAVHRRDHARRARLSGAAARRRLAADGPNTLPAHGRRRPTDPASPAHALRPEAVGRGGPHNPRGMPQLAIVVVVNGAFAFAHEYPRRPDREAPARPAADPPHRTARRPPAGCAAADLVQGDLALLEAGDPISADRPAVRRRPGLAWPGLAWPGLAWTSRPSPGRACPCVRGGGSCACRDGPARDWAEGLPASDVDGEARRRSRAGRHDLLYFPRGLHSFRALRRRRAWRVPLGPSDG
jgi:hypothetical protein